MHLDFFQGGNSANSEMPVYPVRTMPVGQLCRDSGRRSYWYSFANPKAIH